MATYVWDFTQGDKDHKDLLGGKGANLAEMTRLGLPVPPGFTITTEACRAYMRTGAVPRELAVEVTTALRLMEDRLGRRFGDPDDPLLVSVRSGAKFSMPGMMETVLDVGLNDVTVHGLARFSGDERFAWDSYRRLCQMFGRTVLGIDGALFADALDAAKAARGVTSDVDLDAAALRELVGQFQEIVRAHTGRPFPQDPREQLDLAIVAVLGSWNTERARLYRRKERIPDDLGTAVNVVPMVFGNLGPTSGTGVAFTRDPATGKTGNYGDYLANAQGEDVVAGIRNTLSLDDLAERDPAAYADLRRAMRQLETHYRDLCDIEFTIERGKLWMLQTRVGKRTAPAAFRIATQLVDEHLITLDEALARVTGAQLSQLLFPQFAVDADRTLLARGMAASPGAAVGAAVFDSAAAQERAARGEDVVLVRRETNPDDLGGMIAAVGVLTARGGKTSHAAVVARGMGRTCVVGAEAVDIDAVARSFRVDGHVVREGDTVAIDGSTGEVFLGSVPVEPSPVSRYLDEGLDSALAQAPDDDTRELVSAVDRLLTHADQVRRLHVHANADTADDAARARRLGAQGVGLCRTEHQFLGERRVLVERVVLAADDDARQSALDALLPLQRADFTALLEAMDGLPTTIRLLDPPLHEFLPDLTELSVRVALAHERGQDVPDDERLLAAVQRMHEANPMLGLRGVRLGLVVPGLFALQIRAICEAVVERRAAGGDPHAEIMVPLVGSVQELRLVKDEARAIMAEVGAARGVELDLPVGVMIELPRAALTADRIAEEAAFFSFGTNDLTQTTWGFSRDDVEGAFFAQYTDNGVLTVSPFETIDARGVGRLVDIAVAEGRATNPSLSIGVCGEHGGDPESIRFFHGAGLDYVSCSPFRVPVARLEAGRAAVEDATVDAR
ncbi:pyruvate, phosphate dikinase [Cellulomonas fimi]|uniref:Pyruvate, phosphate dikinase n=1 Tax=Cellulomonas fimi (strain ATCC 484 / DSM 20113 / JCM 1341 / CCUG 24087 / LMG 16345 / NBRC 15513 / NCIMB 8980 / NCTC 7547 / NRS-133) TaxID=590998 RepID=F4H2X6_CELFA|nr:pyruvate, phosphate dikinase [Cellulomonas fimi]AEE46475.1 pyruvate, phosphate dikinase [Cellulomonas fimi ATCC 484]NNH08229.1 pyruvate, phosphate dikinase [Cellulomonas fimi]VEH33151.1 Pyruvate, phosphate dikinase [Cellulomonas fimi]